ncbi:MAG: hypothetical protein ACLVEV_11745, partial [Lachnospiraceae bacterium]
MNEGNFPRYGIASATALRWIPLYIPLRSFFVASYRDLIRRQRAAAGWEAGIRLTILKVLFIFYNERRLKQWDSKQTSKSHRKLQCLR